MGSSRACRSGIALASPVVGIGWALIASCSSPYAASSTPVSEPTNEAGSDTAPPDASEAAPVPTCERVEPPNDATKTASLKFTSFSASGADANGWRSRGFDRDGLCSTAMSPDVCKRFGAASADVQEDGDKGIDNSWGRNVAPAIVSLSSSNPAGFLKTDDMGNGSLVLTNNSGDLFVIPVMGARIANQGADATLSALVPREAFVAEVIKAVGRVDPTLCSGTVIESILLQIRQASDILQDGTQSPSANCDAISLGAVLTDVLPANIPAIDAGAGSCN